MALGIVARPNHSSLASGLQGKVGYRGNPAQSLEALIFVLSEICKAFASFKGFGIHVSTKST